MTTRSFLAAGILVLVVAACGDDSSDRATVPPVTDTSAPDGDVAGDVTGDVTGANLEGAWDVVAIELDGRSVALLADWPVTMTIDGDQIGGTAACNGHGGAVAIDGDEPGSFAVGDLAQTEMACVDVGVMQIESDFLVALGRVDSYEVGGGLVLRGADGTTVIELRPQPELDGAELTGTTWVLDTVTVGGSASTSEAMTDVVLEFGDDGTLTGFAGCRQVTGAWQLDGDLIQVPPLALDGHVDRCSPDAADIEQGVAAVLETGTRVTIDGDRLTLSPGGGDEVFFRSA